MFDQRELRGGESPAEKVEKSLVWYRDNVARDGRLSAMEDSMANLRVERDGQRVERDTLVEMESILTGLQMQWTQAHVAKLLGEALDCSWESEYGVPPARLEHVIDGIEIEGMDSALFALISDGIVDVMDLSALCGDDDGGEPIGITCYVKRGNGVPGMRDGGSARLRVNITGEAFKIFFRVFSRDIERIRRIRERIPLPRE